MKKFFELIGRLNQLFAYPAEKGQSVALLAMRLYASWMFLPAGILKIRTWDTTLFLFQEEYHVPLLPPELAAWLGTGGEIIFPILLSLGLLTRFSAAGLFAVNAVAVMSLVDIPPAAFNEHVVWGLALAVVMLWGGGRISADHWLPTESRAGTRSDVATG